MELQKIVKEGSPGVRVNHRYTNISENVNDTENIVAVVIESIKGEPFVPVEVTRNKELYSKFKVSEPAFFDCGGYRLIAIRAVAEDSTNEVKSATHKLKDSTDADVLNFELYPGDYEVFITAGFNDGLNRVVIEEDGFDTEKYSADTIAGLARKIKKSTNILKNFNPDFDTLEANTNTLATLVKTKFGTGTGNSPGSNGLAGANGKLNSTDVNAAHEKALKVLESYSNPEMGIVYCKSDDTLLQAKYLEHADNTNAKEKGKWRGVIIGCNPNLSVTERVNFVKSCNSENVWAVIDDAVKDNVLYNPCDCVPAIAGTIARFAYNIPVFGRTDDTVIGDGLFNFFDDIGTIYIEEDYDRMNEAGGITFDRDEYGIKIREDVTTAQPDKAETDTDRIFGVRIVHNASRRLRKVGKEAIGTPITDITQTEIQQNAIEALRPMINDNALIDVYSEDGKLQYKAVDVSVNIISKADMTVGMVSIKARINRAYSVRIADIEIEVS